jgi:hypothetical protein
MVEEVEYWNDYFHLYVEPDEEADEPFSNLIYPIADHLDAFQTPDDEHEANHLLTVAIISTTIYFREILEYILPEGRNGLICIFQNPCAASFSYQIK